MCDVSGPGNPNSLTSNVDMTTFGFLWFKRCFNDRIASFAFTFLLRIWSLISRWSARSTWPAGNNSDVAFSIDCSVCFLALDCSQSVNTYRWAHRVHLIPTKMIPFLYLDNKERKREKRGWKSESHSIYTNHGPIMNAFESLKEVGCSCSDKGTELDAELVKFGQIKEGFETIVVNHTVCF